MANSSDKTQVIAQSVLAGRWRLDGKLGEGGMGSVLRGFDLQNNQPVAIKLLSLELADQPEFVMRFEREARLLSRLNHPGLVPLVAVDQEAGRPFFVMKLIEGTTLSKRIKERGKLAQREVLPFVQQLAVALDFLHARGIVHRDLKPSNIMISANERVTLVDFGISRQNNTTHLTLPGVMVGTPQYMAPEQILTGDVTPASDIYSLSLLTWRMLVGKHAFVSESEEGLISMQLSLTPKLAHEMNAEVPEAVSHVLHRSLDKDPAKRHQTATEFYQDLLKGFGGDDTTSEPDATTAPDVPITRNDKPLQISDAETRIKLEPTSEKPAMKEPFPLQWVAIGVGVLAVLAALVWYVS